MGIKEDYNEPVMILQPDKRLSNDNDQTNDIVESGEFSLEKSNINEYGNISFLNTGIGMLIFAIADYITAHYILYKYAGVWILEYGAYFATFCGIIYFSVGIIGRVISFINKRSSNF